MMTFGVGPGAWRTPHCVRADGQDPSRGGGRTRCRVDQQAVPVTRSNPVVLPAARDDRVDEDRPERVLSRRPLAVIRRALSLVGHPADRGPGAAPIGWSDAGAGERGGRRGRQPARCCVLRRRGWPAAHGPAAHFGRVGWRSCTAPTSPSTTARLASEPSGDRPAATARRQKASLGASTPLSVLSVSRPCHGTRPRRRNRAPGVGRRSEEVRIRGRA
jgi:hypothetical protein